HREELRNAGGEVRGKLKPLGRLLLRAEERLDEHERGALEEALTLSSSLEVVYRFRQQLQAIYEQRSMSRENLLALLQDWCQRAEKTGIQALQDFSRTLRGYTLPATT
ncbi:MAG: transposase, partial [Gammaproteobacteria bacterium]